MEMTKNINWREWVDRWDRMQEYYLVARSERFSIITELIRTNQEEPSYVIDLGCGTGTLTLAIMDAFPNAHVYGFDIDPTLLPLAVARTSQHSDRAHYIQVDIRDADWMNKIPSAADAVISATALHWLSEDQLASLYNQITSVLKPGGVFLNADHVASESQTIQQSWERHRDEILGLQRQGNCEDWDSFWKRYLAALGPQAAEARKAALGEWCGIEQGLPLFWHFEHLRDAGLTAIDCFWRSDCDAIYGGIKK